MRRIMTSAAVTIALACAFADAQQQSSPASIYEAIAPAVVMVETSSAGGSGLLLDSNTILTAAHVLYPYRSARIVFSDGTELLEVPVIGWDLLTDVAVLGPVQLDPPPALPPFDTSNDLPVGAELFTVGYPGEVEPFPQPTISRGILSRYRRWPEQDVTYLQTDAAVNEGQSGGVLVSAAGAVVGMTVFGGYFGRFGMALSAADLLPRVAALLAGEEDPQRPGAQDLAAWAPATPIPFELDHLWAEQAFAIDAPLDAEVSFTLQGVSDLAVEIVDWAGYLMAEVDETESGTESISAVLDGVAPFLLLVEQFDDQNVLVQVEGDARHQLDEATDDPCHLGRRPRAVVNSRSVSAASSSIGALMPRTSVSARARHLDRRPLHRRRRRRFLGGRVLTDYSTDASPSQSPTPKGAPNERR